MKRESGSISAAIIGLGNIGFGFNADRKRSGVWTHERAFAKAGGVRLIAAADPVPSQRDRFHKARPEVPVFSSVDELLRHGAPDLVSICVPTAAHAQIAKAVLAAGARAVFCEKPIAGTTAQALDLIRFARKRGAVLAVNHTRRWDPAYLRAAATVRRGGIGQVRSVAARYSGHVYNVGTHLLDAVRMITGLAPLLASGFSPRPADEDPHVSGLVTLGGGVACTLSCHGRKEDLLFEIDAVGSEGRLRIVDNGARTIYERFKQSRRFGGYRELSARALPPPAGQDRFVAAILDIRACLRRPGRTPACSGEDGYYALAAAQALAESARQGSRPRPIPPLSRLKTNSEAPWKN